MLLDQDFIWCSDLMRQQEWWFYVNGATKSTEVKHVCVIWWRWWCKTKMVLCVYGSSSKMTRLAKTEGLGCDGMMTVLMLVMFQLMAEIKMKMARWWLKDENGLWWIGEDRNWMEWSGLVDGMDGQTNEGALIWDMVRPDGSSDWLNWLSNSSTFSPSYLMFYSFFTI